MRTTDDAWHAFRMPPRANRKRKALNLPELGALFQFPFVR